MYNFAPPNCLRRLWKAPKQFKTFVFMLIFGQNSNPTNFDRLLKKFHKRTDATIHTNEIAQRRQITNDVHAL